MSKDCNFRGSTARLDVMTATLGRVQQDWMSKDCNFREYSKIGCQKTATLGGVQQDWMSKDCNFRGSTARLDVKRLQL